MIHYTLYNFTHISPAAGAQAWWSSNPWSNNNYGPGYTRIFCQYHSGTSRHKNHLWILSHPISSRFLLLSSQSPVDPVSSPLLLLISQEADIGKFFQIQNLMIYSLWTGSRGGVTSLVLISNDKILWDQFHLCLVMSSSAWARPDINLHSLLVFV